MRFTPVTLIPVFALALAACGSDSSPTAVQNGNVPLTTDANGVPAVGSGGNAPATALVSNNASSSKMAQQSTASADEQADLSETATTGEDDDSGVAPEPKGTSADFDFKAKGGAGWGAGPVKPKEPMDAFEASISFKGKKHGNGMLSGNVNAMVTPNPRPVGSASAALDANMSMVFTLDFNKTMKNGDTVTVVTEPNIVVTKTGRRDRNGTVTRTIDGTVHRTLTSVKNANDNFDLTISHTGTKVVDVYASNKLSTRTTSGTTTVVNNISGETAVTTFNDLQRGKPGACQCPTAGSVVLKVTAKDGTVSDHTYTFAGCGSADVDVRAEASASAAAGAKGMGTNDGMATAGNANGTVSSSARVTGKLTWADCAVDPQ